MTLSLIGLKKLCNQNICKEGGNAPPLHYSDCKNGLDRAQFSANLYDGPLFSPNIFLQYDRLPLQGHYRNFCRYKMFYLP